MMNYLMKNIVTTLLVLASVGTTSAQDALLTEPSEFWTAQIVPSDQSNGGVRYRNGCVMTPDASLVLVTSGSGTVTALDAITGGTVWEYLPPQPAVGLTYSSSQIVFTTDNAATPYMVYSIIMNENAPDPVSHVIALDMDGEAIWVSEELTGIAEADPLISDDGSYVFLTHNSNDKTVGHFTILSAADADAGQVFYTAFNETTSFGPAGIFHSPIEGNYDDDAGRDNRNDMILWGSSVSPDATFIERGNIFGFQFPRDFDGNATTTEISYLLLGDETRDFRTNTAPVLLNDGLSGYFSASRSSFWGWRQDRNVGRFNRAPNAGTQGWTRNPTFAGEPTFAKPALTTSDPNNPTVFGGSADVTFTSMDSTFDNNFFITVESLIKAETIIDPFERVVYFVEEAGFVHQMPIQASVEWQPNWSVDLGFTTEGNMALHPTGQILYVADATGFVTALQVSDIPATPVPTMSPTVNATEEPTMTPTMMTASPTAAPVAVPETPAPVDAPITPAPVDTPVDAPTDPPVDTPTESAANVLVGSTLVSFATVLVATFLL